MAKRIFLFVILLSFLIFTGYALRGRLTTKQLPTGKLHVVTSIYPMYYFASQIAGDKAVLQNITPAGSEPHDYEPTTKDVAAIEKSDLLIINGDKLESWGDQIKQTLSGTKVVIVTASNGIVSQTMSDKGVSIPDPHIWLDPVLAKKEVANIVQGFMLADPDNRDYYLKNQRLLNNKLDQLDKQFRSGLKDCTLKDIVTSHAAFGYVADEYGLKQISIAGISPDQEPSAKQLADIVTIAKKNDIKYIFFETLVSPKLSQTIANEIGAKTIVFNPLEGLTQEQIDSRQDYFSVQFQNLTNLKTALECR